VVSTSADLNRCFRALLAGRLLPKRLLAEMKPTSGYGLGLARLELPCGAALGHDGLVFGYLTYSFSTPDGRRQVSVNASYYLSEAELNTMLGFVRAALCGQDIQARP
jgi:D-alanyl-D-alanine carboxypeptidase